MKIMGYKSDKRITIRTKSMAVPLVSHVRVHVPLGSDCTVMKFAENRLGAHEIKSPLHLVR